jgi:hypothetical protein
MTTQELNTLKRDLAFAVWAIKMLKMSPCKAMDGAMWVRIFDIDHVPDAYREDLTYVDTDIMERAIPEIAIMYEIKVLEYQKDLAEKRLAELRSL